MMDTALLLQVEPDPIICQPVHIMAEVLDNYHHTSQGSQYLNSLSDRVRTNTTPVELLNHPSSGSSPARDDCLCPRMRTRTPNNVTSCSSPTASTPTTYATQSAFKVSPNTFHDVESTTQIRPETDNECALPPKKLYTDDIPVLDSFPGYYGFDLYRPLCGDSYEASETKPSTAFFYFKDEQGWTNLYAKKTPTWWTLSYWCQRQPPEGSFLRLTPVYGASDKQQEVIQRCFEDFMAIPTCGMARYSIVMVGNSLAEYFFDPTTERLCVTLPYERPKEGCEYSQFNGKFMCFNSCLYNGGQGNKKPLFLIVTLERLVTGSDPSKGQCEVLGRQCIKFRSCACPKRDKENNERRTGDTLISGLQSLGKRRKDSMERNDRQSKKPKANQRTSTDNHNFDGKILNALRDHWVSPSQDQMNEESCADGSEDIIDVVQDTDYETDQPIINFNGESYNLFLVPTNLPGAADTLAGVRLGLLRTWIYSLTKEKLSPTRQLDENGLKRESMNGFKNCLDGGGKTELVNRISNSHSRSLIGNTLNQLAKVESHLAAIVRDRMNLINMCQTTYQFSGDSTDSQPNSISAGAVGFGHGGATDETANPNPDYFQTPILNSLTTDPTTPTHTRSLSAQQQQQQQQTNLMHNMAYALSASVNRTTMYPNSQNPSAASNWTYEIDNVMRVQPNHTDQIYSSHTILTNNPNCPSIRAPDLLESYALVQNIPQSLPSPSLQHPLSTSPGSNTTDQHASAFTTATTTSHTINSSCSKSLSVLSSGSTLGSNHNLIGTNFTSTTNNHEFTSSAFYPTSYFGTNQRSTDADQITLLDNFAGTRLPGLINQSNIHSTLCGTSVGYVPTGPTTIAESLLLSSEEALNHCLEKRKYYDETDGGIRAIMNRNLDVSAYCISSSSNPTRSPDSTSCEKLVKSELS